MSEADRSDRLVADELRATLGNAGWEINLSWSKRRVPQMTLPGKPQPRARLKDLWFSPSGKQRAGGIRATLGIRTVSRSLVLGAASPPVTLNESPQLTSLLATWPPQPSSKRAGVPFDQNA
jgi:hypothetical protein